MIFALPAYADGGTNTNTDKKKETDKSKDLPEAPIVLLYPAAGMLTYLGYRLIAARRSQGPAGA